MTKFWTYFLVFFLLTSSLTTNAQGNISLFAEEGTEWSVGNFGMNPNLPSSMSFIKMIGDTIIEDMQYHILRTNDYFFSETNPGDIAAFVRITENDALYLRTITGEEYKVFEFGFENGDYAYLKTYNGINLTAQVCEYTTVNYCGQPRRKWVLCGIEPCDYSHETWIEGIGPLDGILLANFDLLGYLGANPQLLCASLNGVQIYDNPDYDFCEYFTTTFWDRFYLVGELGNSWTVGVIDQEDNCLYTDSLNIGDVTLDGTSFYYGTYYYIIYTHIFNPVNNLVNSSYFGARMFADSLLSIKPQNNEEHLIFDFKAHKDDTLDLWSYDYYTNNFYAIRAWIENTDSVLTSHGMRKSWTLTNEFGTTLWLEGLGNDEGLIRANFALTGLDTINTEMICSKYNYTQIYQNPDFDFCSLYSLIQIVEDANQNSNRFSIFPNPTNDFVTISTNNPEYLVLVYDISGKEIFTTMCDGNSTKVDFSNYPDGIYFVNILSEGKSYREKILKF